MAREITVHAGRGHKTVPPADVPAGLPRLEVFQILMSLPQRVPLSWPEWWLLAVLVWLLIPFCVQAAGEQMPDGNLLNGWRIQDRAPNRPAAGSARELVIVATTDLHGWITRDTLFPAACPGGRAHLAPIITGLRRVAPGLILLDGGDTLQSAPNLEYLARRDPGYALPSPCSAFLN